MSRDLARELLARRDNDVRIEVLLDGEVHRTALVELRDQDPTIHPNLNAGPVVTYDTENDVIVIRAGLVPAAGPDAGEAQP